MNHTKLNTLIIGLILFLSLGLLVIDGKTQNNDISTKWEQTYAGFNPMHMIATVDQGFAILAYDESGKQYLLKTDSFGEIQWTTSLESTSCMLVCELIQTKNEGFLIAEDVYDQVKDNFDLLLIMIEKNGKIRWYKTFGGLNHEYGNSIIQTADGSYLLAGATGNETNKDYDGILVKIDQYGNVKWYKTYGGKSIDIFTSVLQNKDGSFTIGGITNSYGIEDSKYEPDFWLVKTDSDGNTQWNKTLGTSSLEEYSWSMIQTIEGGYLLHGEHGLPPYSLYNWLVKTNDNGELEWNKSIGNLGTQIEDIIQTPDGGFIATGENKKNYFYVAKIDKKGEVEWEKLKVVSNHAIGKEVILTSNTTIAVLGDLNGELWLFETNIDNNSTSSTSDISLLPSFICLVTISLIIMKKRRIIR